MLPPHRSTMGLLPMPEHRRRRLRPLMYVGVVLAIAGRLLDIGFVWGLGVGMIVMTLIARLLDWNARRRATP